MDTPMSHSEYEELAAGYVLGALEPDDEHRTSSRCWIAAATRTAISGVVWR